MNLQTARFYFAATVFGAGLAVLTGCMTVGPDYQRPEPATPPNWSTGLGMGLSSAATDSKRLEKWWAVFNDPVLSDLIRQARAGNTELHQAQARVREARARRGITKAGLLPSMEGNATASRSKSSEEAGSGMTGNAYSAGFDASWELDVFGGKRRALESSTATWQAAEESLRDVQVSLLAEVALNYVDLRSYQDLLSITESNVTTRSETYDIARWRHEAGLTTQLDVDQAKLSLEQARAQLPTLRTNLEQAKNRIAVLLGRPPGALGKLFARIKPVPATAKEVAVGVPADLLRRRPDVRTAERQLAAQTAQIGVAKAEMYPSFSLGGSVGLESLAYSDLYSSGAQVARGAAQSAWKLFDGGRIRENIKLQTALQEEALSRYEGAVLTALEDVENSLIAYVNEQSRRDSLAAGVKSGQSAFKLALNQYSSGLVGFQTVLDTQQSLLSVQDQFSVSKSKVASNLIRLYKALGGGWSPDRNASTPLRATLSQTQP
ncbi:MAG: efflux transporter outer membrane subunit [Verrucomicrobia bacterium]|nr:efflux transporter outer membrane subunit [Verrucomicrobiota bacterium]